jgi:hypothetical protein
MERVFFLLLIVGGALAGCDKAKCPSVPKHYEEMGCEAVKGEGECCASR